MIRYNPAVPRIGFGIAAMIMSALTFSLMVVLPSELEQASPALALRAEPDGAAAHSRAAGALPFRCAVATAVNAPLFSLVRLTGPDPQCKQPS